MSIHYPIAEIFHSIQGEGAWSGTAMLFVRLAGCNVGKIQPSGVATCRAVTGEVFVCDTEYSRTRFATPEEMQKECRELHVCITGGEPFLYDLEPLLKVLSPSAQVHIETSGTREIPVSLVRTYNPWITCSPKVGFSADNADKIEEWKFLVGEESDIEAIERFLEDYAPGLVTERLFLQPIDRGGLEGTREAARVILRCLERHPDWRLSLQLHKYIGAR